ncbi:MAG: phytanoyl-CoA dioxygenase family protein [Chitinophagaceae bacterium]|nr:phytanoyl-CoA dioxygenase family protein [Chitinophagaceae bacterium]
MNPDPYLLHESTEPGRLGVLHLKRYWEKIRLIRSGKLAPDAYQEEWNIDNTLLSVLELGLEQTLRYLYQNAPDFGKFESWILSMNKGQLHEEMIREFNEYILHRGSGYVPLDEDHRMLKDRDLEFWKENGYIIIPRVVDQQDCDEAIGVICSFLGIDRYDPGTWYDPHPDREGIMVQLFRHPVLDANRKNPDIRQAFEELWGRKDLWLNTDKVGFNPPETPEWKYPGTGLHWDVSLATPIPFGLQGILYLSDTQENQGAFTLIPGFHNRIEQWLQDLPPGTDPRNVDFHAMNPKPIAANAGDLIIWHHALPHGSSPNHSTLPRFVQYINYIPPDAIINQVWI